MTSARRRRRHQNPWVRTEGQGVPSTVLTASSPNPGKGPECNPHPQRAVGRGFQKSLRARSSPSVSPPGAQTCAWISMTAPGLLVGVVHSASWLISLTNERCPPPRGKEFHLVTNTPSSCYQALPSLSRAHSPQTPVTIVRKTPILPMLLSVGQHLNGTK